MLWLREGGRPMPADMSWPRAWQYLYLPLTALINPTGRCVIAEKGRKTNAKRSIRNPNMPWPRALQYLPYATLINPIGWCVVAEGGRNLNMSWAQAWQYFPRTTLINPTGWCVVAEGGRKTNISRGQPEADAPLQPRCKYKIDSRKNVVLVFRNLSTITNTIVQQSESIFWASDQEFYALQKSLSKWYEIVFDEFE